MVTQQLVNPGAARSGRHRCLRRHGRARLSDLKPKPEQEKCKTLKEYEAGYVHVDIKYLPQMPDLSHRTYLFVAIGRATRWVYVEINRSKPGVSDRAFLKSIS